MTDPTTHTLASSFVHRSISGFVVQGGGFIGTADLAHPNNALPTQVATFAAIQNEPGISNKLGTIAMAKVDGNPNSATSQWFINLANNGGPPANLDTQNGGFTVFGHVTGNGMTTVNQIEAVPVFNLGSPFDSLPLRNCISPNPIKIANLVSISGIGVISPLAFTALQRQHSRRSQFGLANALPDPALELRNAQGALVDSNDNWQTSPQKTQIQASGVAPPNPAEPAVYVSLPAGNYTAIVHGVGATPTGIALAEVYPQ